jgi:5'-nucleotidase / UDP-sugar diphosphatase
MRNRIVTFTAAAALAISLVFLASCSTAPRGHELTIVGMGDIHGQLDSYASMADADGDGVQEAVSTGGISRIATLIRGVEDENPGTVAVVFSGDALSDLYFHAFKGRAIYGLMSESGYEISVFGNHEFDKGPQELAASLISADFECICSDLAVEDTPLDGLCAPFLIKNYDGLRVGYFSLITEGLPYLTSAGAVVMTGGNVETARRAVQELRDRGAQVIVALTHIGLDKDEELASQVPGIDVIFGGHSHSYVDEPVRVGDTFIVAGGERGTHVMRLDLQTDTEGRLDTRSVRYEMLPVDGAVAAAGDIEKKLAAFRDSLPEAVVLGTTEVAWDLSSNAVRGGESPVANLVNDRMRDKFGVDIVMNNAGAFRGKKVYEPGPVTDVMLHSIDEFGNDAVMLTLDGRYLKEILERSAASVGEGGLLHASGLRYAMDLSRTAQELVQDDAGEWTVTVPGDRVTEIQVAGPDGTWQPLDTDREYRVLSNSFIVDKDGDGYFWFGKYGRDRENTYSTMYSILEEIVNKEGVLNPQEPDGRLAVTGR